MDNSKIIYPQPLADGDTIAICSPAGSVDPLKVFEARRVLEQQGWKVRIMPHALGEHGIYSASDDERLGDMTVALTDPEIRAVLCSRGGYGVVHILEQLDTIDMTRDPKWIIGYSDISALHALTAKKGIASIHASMCDHIRHGADDEDNAMLFRILRGERPVVTFPSCSRYDRPGTASGRLIGGNFAVLNGLIGTPYDVFKPGIILFIEDISEPIYKIERMLYQLQLSGVLEKLGGLIVGQFTRYTPDKSYDTMEEMIWDMVAPYSFPVAFNVPIGHVDHNIPVIENATVTLKVTATPTNSLITWAN